MNWEMAGVALTGIALAGTTIVGIWSWVSNRHHATSEQVDDINSRVVVLETRVDTLPTPENLSAYRAEVGARLSSIEAYQKANHERLRRIEEYLLNKSS